MKHVLLRVWGLAESSFAAGTRQKPDQWRFRIGDDLQNTVCKY